MVRYLRIPFVLEQVAHARYPQTLSQLAQRLNLPKTTLMRILSALETAGYVAQAPGNQGYVPGPHATRLALEILGTSNFSRAIQAILARLVAATGESCNLTAPEGDSMRYLARVETRHLLRLKMEVGSRVPLHCTASGKLMLALADGELRKQILDRIVLSPHTPKAITERRRLERALTTIRYQCVGLDYEEFVVGMVAIAVPIVDARGRMVAALACHGPTARVSIASLLNSLPIMREAAISVGRVLGSGSPSNELPNL